jgi:hypothetical protein
VKRSVRTGWTHLWRIIIVINIGRGSRNNETRGFSATVSVPIYDECYMLWQYFVSICIEHCNREANCVAHELASVAMQSKLSYNWVDEPPSFIL